MVQVEQINVNTEQYQPEELAMKQSAADDIAQILTGNFHFRILIAEQCDFTRHLLETFLRCQGYNVVTTRDGLEALQRFYYESTPFDLVIADIDMPGINGNILARHIHILNSAVPVLALSDTSARMGENFDGIITKPIQLSELLKVIEGSLPQPYS